MQSFQIFEKMNMLKISWFILGLNQTDVFIIHYTCVARQKRGLINLGYL